MHQQARPPPRLSASPASSPQVPQARNVDPRDAALASPGLGLPADSVKKLDQIVQNFFNKAAVLIIESRMKVKPSRNANGQRKTNKWFQIETDELDDFKDDLRIWKTSGSMDNRPPPLIIDIYLDTSSLKESQSLVVIDDDGKRWDVMEQLNSFESSSGGSYHAAPTSRNAEVVLERWRIDLKTSGSSPMDDFGPILPTIYKKAIVFFRALFITTKLLPAWKFASQGPAKSSHPALVPRCRIRLAEPGRLGTDLLERPIDGRREAVTEYVFGDLEVPVGRLSAAVTYRNDCSFRVDDSESLLSSRFMGVDENFFKPSLPQRAGRNQGQVAEAGSLRDHRRRTGLSDLYQTYGSMSTFHGDGPLGTSPLSALRAVKSPGSDTHSPPATLPAAGGSLDAGPGSMPIAGRISAPRPVTGRPESAGRRPSISFQPFKAGSLSGSPVPRHNMEPESPASTHSQGRPGLLIGSQPRNRSSLTAGMAASLRGGPPSTSVDAPITGSPRPASSGRYSSSFTHRRGRLSTGRAGDEEQGSSGRQSLASSVAQPGSGLLAEAGGTSSGSLHVEEDDISDFLKALDSRKTLKSFEPTHRGDSTTNRTVAQLSKFHLMRDANNALTESMTSSMQMQPSSSSSSRQLTSVPGMVAPASLSASSSPGKPVSPHTPHTPAIPSRLSENSIIDYTATGRITARGGRRQASMVPEVSRESTVTQEGTNAIDIPLSPRVGSYQRRSSSAVAQQSRAIIDDEDADLAFAAHRSISYGANAGNLPTMSILLGRQMQSKNETSGREGSTASGLQPAADIQPSDASTSDVMQHGSTEDNLPDGLISSAVQSDSGCAFTHSRRRCAGMGMGAAGSKATPPQSSRGSFTGSLSRMGRGDDDSVGEEPLVFDLSEMDAQGRRSLEDGRGGRVRTASSERSAFEPRGISRRGW
ncbi:autophagy protein 13 [Claviceps citrina]|nr:autophagy protein 13 [Claviceps citrina]